MVIQNDVSSLLSPAMFDEFLLPYTRRECEYFLISWHFRTICCSKTFYMLRKSALTRGQTIVDIWFAMVYVTLVFYKSRDIQQTRG